MSWRNIQKHSPTWIQAIIEISWEVFRKLQQRDEKILLHAQKAVILESTIGKEGTMYFLKIGLKAEYEWNNEIEHSEVHIQGESCTKKIQKII